MRTIIVEDNPSAARVLRNLIREFSKDLQVLGTASNVIDGIKLVKEIIPELVFLDVELPPETGFELLQKLDTIDFKVIFTTAHEKYALQAIKFSALDFLLKPIDPEELEKAIRKAKETIEKEFEAIKIKTLLSNIKDEKDFPQKIALTDKYGLQIINIKDIIRLEAQGSYTKFFIKNQEILTTSKILKEYEKMLPPTKFFRSHQSHLINLEFLLRYDKRDGDVLILKDGSQVPLAIRKKEILLNIIHKL